MVEVALAWAESYRQVRPDVAVSLGGGGSQVGISGLINGTVDLANCSREFKPREIEAAQKAGREPVRHQVGWDGIAIYVHRDNPLKQITRSQLKDIYSDAGKITRWSDMGITLPSGDDEIVVISRQSNSGTYEYFREAVLGKEINFRLGTRDMNGSKDVVDLCSKVTSSIGYSGLSYATAEVRMVPVVNEKTEQPVMPTIDSVLDRSYPISRPLFMYTIGEPSGPTADYLQWILSDDGQRVLLKRGYPPLRKL
jgi:phosphate transport system substrate-binding protein